MSTTIDLSFVRQYEREVHEAFQRQGSKLLNTTRTKQNVVGKSTTFQVIGKGMATTKARHGTITPMNQTHTPRECVLSDFYAGDWVDALDELKVNIDERMAVANGGAWALGRKVDDQIVTALNGTSQTVITWTMTAVGARAALLSMVEALNSNDVPDDGNRWGLLTPRAWSFAMLVDEFASSDYIGSDSLPYRTGMTQVKNWLGVNWMSHTGLPGISSATAKGFVYHKNAIGYASGASIESDITWHGDRAAHFVNHSMSGGAVLIEDAGVIEATINDTTAVPTS